MALSEMERGVVEGRRPGGRVIGRGRSALETAGLLLCGGAFGTALGFGGGLADAFGGGAGYGMLLVGIALGAALARIDIELFAGISATLAMVNIALTAASRRLDGAFVGFDAATSALLAGMGLWLMALVLRRWVGQIDTRRLRVRGVVSAAGGLAAAMVLGAGQGNADSSLIWSTAVIAATGCGAGLLRFGGPSDVPSRQ